MTRGGRRIGAGAPKKEVTRVKITPTIAPVTRDWLKEEANRRRISQGQLIDELVVGEQSQLENEKEN